MKIHAISTGKVKITQNWRIGREDDPLRLVHTFFDRRFTDWLPIFCFVVEHPEGLIVIDTGIPANANAPTAQHITHKQILEFAAQTPMVYLPAHEWDTERRLMTREIILRS
jgi:hypothetical protein